MKPTVFFLSPGLYRNSRKRPEKLYHSRRKKSRGKIAKKRTNFSVPICAKSHLAIYAGLCYTNDSEREIPQNKEKLQKKDIDKSQNLWYNESRKKEKEKKQ